MASIVSHDNRHDDEALTTQLTHTNVVPESSAPPETPYPTTPLSPSGSGWRSYDSLSTGQPTRQTAIPPSTSTSASAGTASLASLSASGSRSGAFVGIVSGTVAGGLLILGVVILLLLRLFSQKRRGQKSHQSVPWHRRYFYDRRTRLLPRIFRESPRRELYEIEALPPRHALQTPGMRGFEEMDRDLDIEEIRDMLVVMRRQLGYLQQQHHLQDDWAPHDPPPGYSTLE